MSAAPALPFPLPLPVGIRSRFVDNRHGLNVHVLEAGFEAGDRPVLLLLHGFPELAYSWRKVMLPLAQAGYQASARQILLALGMLLQPVMASSSSRLEKSLVLPLPDDPMYRNLVAAFWMHLITPFLVRADFELALFVTPKGRGVLFSLNRMAAFLQAGLLLPAQDEALTVQATRKALAKLDADPDQLLK